MSAAQLDCDMQQGSALLLWVPGIQLSSVQHSLTLVHCTELRKLKLLATELGRRWGKLGGLMCASVSFFLLLV